MSTRERGHFRLDQRALARALGQAAGGHEAAAWLQRRARAELLQRLQWFKLEPHCVLDLGAGTCQGALELARRYPAARVLAVDLAHGMLAAAPRGRWGRRRRFGRVCADAYALPLATHRCDLIYSNLMLQWCDRIDELCRELARVLRPGGLLLFASLGAGALQELRAAWTSADAGPHVHEFPDMPQLAGALMRAGFVEPVIDLERELRHYPNVLALMRELKRLGCQNAAAGRRRNLGGRAALAAMCAAYEQQREPGGVPATFELLFGAAFAGEAPVHPVATTASEYVVPARGLRLRQRSPRSS
jgi:malonyl-CoA O-methyltransferase